MLRIFCVSLFVTLVSGCIRPPEIVLVDRATALEQQASGSFEELETKLQRNAATPRPIPLTPEQIEAIGIRQQPFVDQSELTDAGRVDLLLKQHCLGEAKDGTIRDTPDACRGAADRDLIATLVERVNLARLQLWRWLHERQPKRSVEELRRAWHA
ncbi:MAG: DUF1318 domain-containing protein, partial [Polyangia bacterium]